MAAAIKVGAQIVVTNDLGDFPTEALAPWDIEARSADEFLLAMVDLNPKVVFGEVQRIADSKRRPPMSVDEVLTALSNQGLVETVTALRS